MKKLENRKLKCIIKDAVNKSFSKSTINDEDEFRIYLISQECDLIQNVDNAVEKISNEDFINQAYNENQVYSLQSYVELYNKDSDLLPLPDYSYIRILPKRVYMQIEQKDLSTLSI